MGERETVIRKVFVSSMLIIFIFLILDLSLTYISVQNVFTPVLNLIPLL